MRFSTLRSLMRSSNHPAARVPRPPEEPIVQNVRKSPPGQTHHPRQGNKRGGGDSASGRGYILPPRGNRRPTTVPNDLAHPGALAQVQQRGQARVQALRGQVDGSFDGAALFNETLDFSDPMFPSLQNQWNQRRGRRRKHEADTLGVWDRNFSPRNRFCAGRRAGSRGLAVCHFGSGGAGLPAQSTRGSCFAAGGRMRAMLGWRTWWLGGTETVPAVHSKYSAGSRGRDALWDCPLASGGERDNGGGGLLGGHEKGTALVRWQKTVLWTVIRLQSKGLVRGTSWEVDRQVTVVFAKGLV